MHKTCSYASVKHVTTEARSAPNKRDIILEATIRVLRDRGLSGLKVEEVAKEAEVGKGTVYLYFEDKQDLLKALVEYHTMRFYNDAAAISEENRSFRERLERLLARRIDFVAEWRGLWAAVAREADPQGQQAWLTGLHRRYQGILERFIASGIASGELRPELNVPLTAAALAAFGCNPQIDFPREAYVRQLAEVFMKGVCV